jgi:hypothetical protein
MWNSGKSSETSVDFQQTTWCYIPEDRTLHNHCCENLKSYICIVYFIAHCTLTQLSTAVKYSSYINVIYIIIITFLNSWKWPECLGVYDLLLALLQLTSHSVKFSNKAEGLNMLLAPKPSHPKEMLKVFLGVVSSQFFLWKPQDSELRISLVIVHVTQIQ